MSTLTQTVDLGLLGELELEIEYSYSPGTADVMYMPNGDPGYPGDPAELAITRVSAGTLDLTALFDGCDALSDLVYDEASSTYVDDRESDRADYENDRRREAAWELEEASRESN